MTTQTLMSDNISRLESAQAASTQQSLVQQSGSSSVPSTAQPKKLPYQANHQVELLHLQAEIDALLQQLQNLKQQRSISDEGESVSLTQAPVLAGRF